jgi:hypothetical protein
MALLLALSQLAGTARATGAEQNTFKSTHFRERVGLPHLILRGHANCFLPLVRRFALMHTCLNIPTVDWGKRAQL